MAEGMRLFQHLRQLFPRRRWEQSWRLVTDYRIAIGPRKYPVRDIPLTDLYKTEDMLPKESLRRRIIGALLQGGGDDVKLSDFQRDALYRLLEQDGNNMLVVTGAGLLIPHFTDN